MHTPASARMASAPCAAASSMQLSRRWGLRSKEAFGERSSQALFGIVQGSTYEDLEEAAINYGPIPIFVLLFCAALARASAK